MELRITARHFELVEPLKEFAHNKITLLRRYSNNLAEAHLILSPEGVGYKAELTVSGKRANFFAHATADTINTAIEDVTHKIERQLKEKKSRLKRIHKQSRRKYMPPELGAEL